MINLKLKCIRCGKQVEYWTYFGKDGPYCKSCSKKREQEIFIVGKGKGVIIGKNVKFGKDVLIWNWVVIQDGCEIGGNVQISSFVDIGKDVKIGDGCLIQAGVTIPNRCTIGKNVFIGPQTFIGNGRFPPAGDFNPVIEDNVVIGGNCSIITKRIGHGAVIGAGSIVTKDVEPDTVVAGNPAWFLYTRAEYERRKKAFV